MYRNEDRNRRFRVGDDRDYEKNVDPFVWYPWRTDRLLSAPAFYLRYWLLFRTAFRSRTGQLHIIFLQQSCVLNYCTGRGFCAVRAYLLPDLKEINCCTAPVQRTVESLVQVLSLVLFALGPCSTFAKKRTALRFAPIGYSVLSKAWGSVARFLENQS